MKKWLALLVLSLFLAHGARGEDGNVYVAAEGIYHLNHHGADERNSFGKILYVERAIGSGWSVFGQLYHDSAFHSAYGGVAKHVGNVQIGLGVGPAWYLGRSRTAVNPWIYYEHEAARIEALLYAEVYLGDPVRFYKGYAQKTLESNIVLGVYGESFAGIGPMVGYQFTNRFSVRAVVPTAKRPGEGGVRALILFKWTFE